MKDLKQYIQESIKTLRKTNDHKLLQLIDRNFDKNISDNDFKKLIKKDIDEVFKSNDKVQSDIVKVNVQLNPITNTPVVVCKDKPIYLAGSHRIYWDNKAVDELLKTFHNFKYINRDGEEVELWKDVTGWSITVADYDDKRKTSALLQVNLTKEAEKEVDNYLYTIGQSISGYYSSKKADEYTGD